MPACPVCFGEGHLDLRDDDALIGEHWTDAEIASALEAGMRHPVGIIDCEECETTGVVSQARLDEMQAVARERVARVIRQLEVLERLG